MMCSVQRAGHFGAWALRSFAQRANHEAAVAQPGQKGEGTGAGPCHEGGWARQARRARFVRFVGRGEGRRDAFAVYPILARDLCGGCQPCRRCGLAISRPATRPSGMQDMPQRSGDWWYAGTGAVNSRSARVRRKPNAPIEVPGRKPHKASGNHAETKPNGGNHAGNQRKPAETKRKAKPNAESTAETSGNHRKPSGNQSGNRSGNTQKPSGNQNGNQNPAAQSKPELTGATQHTLRP